MGCCNKNSLVIPPEQQKLINEINKRSSSVVKSNRSPRGTIAKQCLNCGTKTIVNICPVCRYPIK